MRTWSSLLKRPEKGTSLNFSLCHGVCVCVCVCVCVYVFAIYLMSHYLWHTDTHRATADLHSGLVPAPSHPTTGHMECVVCLCLTLTLTQLVSQEEGNRSH